MEYMESEGKTKITIEAAKTGATFIVSVLSKRGASLAMSKSARDAWKYDIAHIIPEIQIGPFCIMGFQPETGFHIAYMAR